MASGAGGTWDSSSLRLRHHAPKEHSRDLPCLLTDGSRGVRARSALADLTMPAPLIPIPASRDAHAGPLRYLGRRWPLQA